MKKIFFVISLFAAFSAFASQEIYESFRAEEQTTATSRLEINYSKSAGGLSCTKTSYLEAEAVYNCDAEVKSFDSAVVYELLGVEEVLMPSSRLEVKHQKKVGRLVCDKVTPMDEESNYNCSIKL